MDEQRAMQLVIVGHTGVGKTSLLRTLTRRRDFGEVSPHHGTTRDVRRIGLGTDTHAALDLFDTPGLEDASALRQYIEDLSGGDHSLDGPDKVKRFLDSPEASRRFEQEAKVLRQLLKSDAALYVLDVREPILQKYLDELELLNLCGVPLLPVLNFTHAAPQGAIAWEERVRRRGIHTIVAFDVVSPPEDGEQKLYDGLVFLRPRFKGQIDALLAWHEEQRVTAERAAIAALADFVVELAAARLTVPYATGRKIAESDAEQAKRTMNRWLRARHRRCLDAILTTYGFDANDATLEDKAIQDPRWDSDLLNLETFKFALLKSGKYAGIGAAIGAVVDVALLGTTLGSGTVIGGGIGGAWGAKKKVGDRVAEALGGEQLTIPDDAILDIALGLLFRVHLLQRRGHAAQQPLEPGTSQRRDEVRLPPSLEKARAHPEWSGLASSGGAEIKPGAVAGRLIRAHDPARQKMVRSIASWLGSELALHRSPT